MKKIQPCYISLRAFLDELERANVDKDSNVFIYFSGGSVSSLRHTKIEYYPRKKELIFRIKAKEL